MPKKRAQKCPKVIDFSGVAKVLVATRLVVVKIAVILVIVS